ncbi:MAG: PP2C family serine/threonine-protein phosphatase [Propionicimonas sp.]|nr:serine/threonine-protein phosphatase [Propionicimonas sp.]
MSTESPWPLLGGGGETPPTAAGGRCPNCTYPVTAWASFCEGCGAPLLPTEPPPPPSTTQGSAQTRRLGVAAPVVTCPLCGGTIDADGYCQTCGAKAPSRRDHLEVSAAAWLAGVCDRGVAHPRNEDAMALWAAPDAPVGVLVVCDGVSTSSEADIASQAGVDRACGVLAGAALTATTPDAEVADLLVRAAAEANAAISEATAVEGPHAGSATFAAAVVLGDAVHFASLGDSRVYWLGDDGNLLLTRDDSVAQEFIEQGMPRAEAEAMPKAHAITRWLGSDATDIAPRTGSHRPARDGWLLVCSDGLWNYASEPDAVAVQLAAAAADDESPLAVARRLVVWANAQGGHDNVTVAVARYPVRLEEPVVTGATEEGDTIDG